MHILHNGITVILSREGTADAISGLLVDHNGGKIYSPAVAVIGALVAIVLLVILHKITKSHDVDPVPESESPQGVYG